MRIADLTEIEAVTREVHGHGKVEVFDERGRVVQRQKFENFIALPATANAKWHVRRTYGDVWPGVNNDPEPVYPFDRLMLTDSVKVEAAGTEKIMPGRTIGWANRQGHSSNAPLRGVPNVTESVRGSTQTEWVFDFATSQAVGTFQSLGWAYDHCRKDSVNDHGASETNAWWGEAGLSWRFYGFSSGGANPGPNVGDMYGMIHDEATGDAYALTSRGATQIQKWSGLLTQATTAPPRWAGTANSNTGTALTGAMANDFTVANAVYDLGYPGSGAVLWATQNASPYALQRFAFPGGGAVAQTITKPWSAAEPGFLAFDGTHIYCCRNGTGMLAPSSTNGMDPSGPVTIYKVLAADGTIAGSWTHPRRVRALGWDAANSKVLVGDSYGYGDADASSVSVQAGTIQRVAAYSTVGDLEWVNTLTYPSTWATSSDDDSDIRGLLGYQGDLVVNARGDWSGNQSPLLRYKLENLGTRVLLGSPVTKSNLQTMKVTYTFNYA